MRDPSSAPDLATRENVVLAPLDVKRPETITAAVEAGIARFGAIDVVLNNAGLSPQGAFEELYEKWGREVFDVNVFGVMDVTKAILPHFRARRAGLFVNVSSAAGLMGFPLGTLYDATKYAIEGFTEALAYELLPLGIGVKLIEPGLVKTRMTETISLSALPEERIDDYRPISEHMMGVFASMMAAGVPEASSVAEQIYDATTDGTDRLRYIVTPEAAALVESRRSMDDQAFVANLRNMFAAPQIETVQG